MDDAYIGAIMMWAGTYVPQNWMLCAGQSLPLMNYQALYAVIGNTYGGNQTSFNLPDLRNRFPMGSANIGQPAASGAGQVALDASHLPTHSHAASFVGTGGGAGSLQVNVTPKLQVSRQAGNGTDANGAYIANAAYPGDSIGTSAVTCPTFASAGSVQAADLVPVAGLSATATVTGSSGITGGSVSIGATGGGAPFNVVPAFLQVNFIICVQGLFPPRP